MTDNTKPKLRMYIVLRTDLPLTEALLAYGHAALGTYLTWKDDPVMQAWASTSFAKVALAVPDAHGLEDVCAFGEHRLFTESRLHGAPTCVGFRVVEVPDQRLQTLRLWRSQLHEAKP